MSSNTPHTQHYCTTIHRKAQSLAQTWVQNRGYIPRILQDILLASSSLEALGKTNLHWLNEPRVPAGTPDGGRWTTIGSTPTNPIDNKPATKPINRPDGLYIPNESQPPIPQDKRYFIKQADWEAFNHHLQTMGLTPLEKFVYHQTFAYEGGMAQNPNGSAVAGILQDKLKELYDATHWPKNPHRAAAIALVAKLGNLPHNLGQPPNTYDLSPANVAEIYHYLFDTNFLRGAGGNHAFSKIANPYAAAALADTLFRHGDGGGTTLVRETINSFLPVNQRLPYASILQPKDLTIYAKLAKTSLSTLLTRLAEHRMKNAPKEKRRFEYFRYSDAIKHSIINNPHKPHK
jgi:hypothetical protein